MNTRQKWNLWAKTKMKEKKLSQKKLGEKLGKTQGAIGHWLNGKREPSIEDISKIMNVLGTHQIILHSDASVQEVKPDVEEYLEYTDMLNEHSIQVISEAVIADDGMLAMSPLSGCLRMFSPDPLAFAIRVKGDSMFPRINSGEFLVIEPSSEISPGDDVFVTLNQRKAMIKRMGYHREGIYQLLSINQEHRPLTIDEKDIVEIYFIAAIVKFSRYVSL
ncbi:MAG TPA: S24 family peptidase [Arsenophonus nasoniae]|uniref:LexA family transcriptional regulator n=1 Tax=Arsenophonus nasoniae TaxID=638 RepID=UPI0038797BC6